MRNRSDGEQARMRTAKSGEHQDRQAAAGQRHLQELQQENVHHYGGQREQTLATHAHRAMHGHPALLRPGEAHAQTAHHTNGGDNRDMIPSKAFLSEISMGWCYYNNTPEDSAMISIVALD
ncbi:hypothetical protein PoB_001294200 [Plakobranchus ocellatus]|uniref:Uncharacterized protein n=1 Tax=Plakobranchus ocellatus TaxID=259542 RepID=A0AAV3YW89_9GAST|nr:hypothetical protein PoB_001294200 [Plakobranchus ocellatus]